MPLLFSWLFFATAGYSQEISSPLLQELQWRCIGPHRGGRTVGAVGVPQEPNVFYIGVNNGGVWKTDDFGRTWQPLFDDQPTGSIGDIAVAPSNPQVIYVGSGEGLQRPDLSVGDGMYKSTDGGKSWQHLGLSDVQQVARLSIDPTDENRLFVAALGHPYGPNPERGVYRTLDGGKTWQRVLYIDENTGAAQVSIDPQDPNIVYADLWAGRQGPWENGEWEGKESGLYKSTDGGDHWQKLTRGLPGTDEGLGRIGFCIAPSNHLRLYASVDAGEKGGIYRSDDGGESWTQIQSDGRLWGRGDDFAELQVDPKNADIVYSANVVTWKSTDGGKTWNAFRGAPGGDDYHRIWINPSNPDILLIASDQGAIITVNGGRTFSSWYNQPTAQFYHVSTDNAFPYNVYGGQQESGSVGIASRGNDGEITFREWHPVGAQEYGYVAADPLDPDIIYGGKLTRFDKRTGQTQEVSPSAPKGVPIRFIRTAPLLFSPVDPHLLFYAGNVLFKTRDGGQHWQIISPDLSRAEWDIPASVGIYNSESLKHMARRGVIYTIGPSYKDVNIIWAGTDDGLIHLTRDGGKSWKNVTPSGLSSWSKVSLIDAGHFNTNTAFAAVNRIRCDDLHPYIYRTTDGGKSWKLITQGLPDQPVNSVREDPIQPGLLFAGTETAVYVSFDNGDHWQSLRLNMPATSIRDLVIKDNDLVIGTHGRGFWILDDISRLRELAASRSSAFDHPLLFKPAKAIRVRWDMYTDTPLPQEEPAGQNPPDGAIIDYYLPADSRSPVSLDIFDSKGNRVRHYSSLDQPPVIPPNNVPPYWIRPFRALPATAGAHRFLWDMRYDPLPVPASFPISAIYKNTAPVRTAPWVMPGTYRVRLTAEGKSWEKEIRIEMDPRVKTSTADLQAQFDLSMICYRGRQRAEELRNEMQLAISPAGNNSLAGWQKKTRELLSPARGSAQWGPGQIAGSLGYLFNVLQDADRPPTESARRGVMAAREQLEKLEAAWKGLLRQKPGQAGGLP